MVQGMYTAASGMLAQQYRLDTISNNLANTLTTGYKREESIDKAFPELLMRKTDYETIKIPYRGRPSLGSIDKSPVIGKVGTGVEQNEIHAVYEQGALLETNNPADVALYGKGFMVVDTPHGERYTRNGNFILGNGNILMTKEGYPVVGEKGYLRLQKNNFKIDEQGNVIVNAALLNEGNDFVDIGKNDWKQEAVLDTLKLINFEHTRYLKKEGDSLYLYTKSAGEVFDLNANEGEKPIVNQRFLEASNVEPVRQMVEMISVNRAYEAGQKALQSSDESTKQLLSIRL